MTNLSDNIHGQLGESPNKLYKNYCSWFNKTYASSKKPMAFKSWLAWAREKKIVSANGTLSEAVVPANYLDHNADGNSLELKIREIQMPYLLLGAALGATIGHFVKKGHIGLYVGGGVLLGVVVSLLIPKVQATTSSEKGGSGGGGGGSSSVNSAPTPIVVVGYKAPRLVRAAKVSDISQTKTSAGASTPMASINPIQTATQPSTPPIGTNIPTGGTVPTSGAMPTGQVKP